MGLTLSIFGLTLSVQRVYEPGGNATLCPCTYACYGDQRDEVLFLARWISEEEAMHHGRRMLLLMMMILHCCAGGPRIILIPPPSVSSSISVTRSRVPFASYFAFALQNTSFPGTPPIKDRAKTRTFSGETFFISTQIQ